MSTKKTPLKTTLYSIPVLLLTVLFPWNTSDSLKNIEKDLANKEATAATNIQHFDLKNFPVLRIERDAIKKLFDQQSGEARVHKVVFKFYVDATTSYPTLAAFRAKRNDRKYISRTYTQILPSPADAAKTCEIKGIYMLGNLELPRRARGNSELSWEKLWENVKDNTYLYFYPMKDEEDHVTYILAWGKDKPTDCPAADKRTLTESGLNPSPPADPK